MAVAPPSRRDILAGASAGLAAAALPAGVVATPARCGFEPSSSLGRPRFRWWWPGGAIEPAEVAREIDALADAGFGGFEIADVRDGITVPMDPKVYGWGGRRWVAGVEAALEAAARRGLKIDLTLGPHWPTGMPGVTPDDAAASKELVHGGVDVRGGARYAGPLPLPKSEPPGIAQGAPMIRPVVTPRLISLQAFRIIARTGDRTTLDPASMIDLSPLVRDGAVEWAAPDGGEWRLIAFWMRGTAQIQNMFGMNKQTSMLADPVPFVVDIYGKAGARACIDYWNAHILNPRVRTLLARAGDAIFEDSLEMAAEQHWSPTLPEEFRRRRGYDLIPLLAAVAAPPGGVPAVLGLAAPASASLYALAGVDGSRVLHDFACTLGEMYAENRVGTLSTWAHSLGLGFRAQVIGSDVTSGVAATYADIPEGDNSQDLDGWRNLAAGRDIGGKPRLSDEAGTFVGGSAHIATWRELFYMLQRDFAVGVNQVVIHGFSYADAPGAGWPGFSAFGRAIGNDWGPRDPLWTLADDAAAYLGRVQHLLQSGRAVTEVAVIDGRFGSGTLRNAGYTYACPSPELLTRPDMVVRDRRLMPDGPAYRALVVNQVAALEPGVAEAIAGFARAGLPVVVVGAPPTRARGWHEPEAADRHVAEISRRLLAMPGVVTVAREAEVAGALALLHVEASFGYGTPGRLFGSRREAGGDTWLFLLNDSEEARDEALSVLGTGRLLGIDLWSGAIRPVPATTEGGRLHFRHRFAASGTAAFLITSDATQCADLPMITGVTVGADIARGRDGRFGLRADDGDPRRLDSWTLSIEDWRRGAGTTDIRKVERDLGLVPLRPWSAMPGMEGVSGVGRYRTTLELGSLPPNRGGWLDLGAVGGSARLSVNGRRLPPVDPFTLRVDVGPWLTSGTNLIEVVVATPLNNRLRAEGIESRFGPPPGAGAPAEEPASSEPASADEFPPPKGGMGMQPGAAPPGRPRYEQQYGLLGPVLFLPYRVRPLRTDHPSSANESSFVDRV